MTLNVTSNNTQVSAAQTGAPVSVPSTFTSAGATFSVPFRTTVGTGAATGTAQMKVDVLSADYTVRNVQYQVSYTNCTANVAPLVTVGGVSNGARYEFGSVPAATCAWTDDNDGSGTATPTLSSITGSRAADGLGSQTATCSKTDSGGLTTTASATYSIVDTTPPAISVASDITAEATSAAGAVVTYAAPTATDAVDGSRSVSCQPASGATFALGATTVT
ncbi:MAG TPA: HYR domain-containing protein, partial [Pedococcus sp.]|nr:HYR domain-containing protein [Pedococcus sp.]